MPRGSNPFQFTRPRGARRAGDRPPETKKKFQFTRPRGARRQAALAAAFVEKFQFTRPRGARLDGRQNHLRIRRFNSRAHGGRDLRHPRPRIGAGVSIHAPTGGATPNATASAADAAFQFTRPRGARPGSLGGRFRREVSIHAPTGGATPLLGLDTYGASSFNSRAHGGRDSAASHVPHALARFNSRAHGGRDTPFWANPRRKTFQFTRPRGARRLLAVLPCHFVVSIHAPTGGATLRGAPCDKVLRVSIHAPTGGATLADGLPHGRRRFNSRAHGGRDSSARSARASSLFQFTRPRGARQKINYYVIGGQYVSIHAPTGGATPSAKKCLRGKRFQFTRPRGARRNSQP